MEPSQDRNDVSVFELRTDPKRYANFALVNPADEVIYDVFDGRPLKETWRAVSITAADEEDNEAELSDYALLGTVPVFSLRATERLLDLLKAHGELLPLRYRRGEYFAYNVTRMIDGLDERKSVIKRFSTGEVMSVSRYVFRPEVVDRAAVFKIPQLPKAYVFVTDSFVERTQREGLT
jgi:hypothetical protein